MLADWIGSNQQLGCFPYLDPEYSLAEYWPVALERAHAAVRETGLNAPAIAAGYSLSEALPGVFGLAATPLQTWAETEAAITGQSLAAGRGTRRDLTVRRLADAAAAVQVLAGAAKAGRAAVWIRNMVQDARERMRRLRHHCPMPMSDCSMPALRSVFGWRSKRV